MRPVVRDMKLFVQGVQIPGVAEPPVGSTNFALWCLVLIGLEGEGGEDRFDAFACSPAWLAENFTTVDESSGRRLLPWAQTESQDHSFFTPGLVLMPTWSPEALSEAIDRICERCQGPDWPTVASRLTRYLDWEYEYKYDEYVDCHPDQFRLPRGWSATNWQRAVEKGPQGGDPGVR